MKVVVLIVDLILSKYLVFPTLKKKKKELNEIR